MADRITAVIPSWQEEAAITSCVTCCRAVADETIVADGGSTDRTAELAEAAGARVVLGARGRGPQLNAGAAAAEGEVLLFVHADTLLPPEARGVIRQAVGAGFVGGNFKLRFFPETLVSRLYAAANHFRRRALRLYYGDSCIFVRKSVFDALGGFARVPLFEDQDFVRRLERIAPTHYETSVVVSTSSRRFAETPLRTLALWTTLQSLHAAGVPAQKLAWLYADIR